MKNIDIPSMAEIIEEAVSLETDTELTRMREELQEVVDALAVMDPTLALKVKKMAEDFFFGVDDIRNYLKNKTET